jgi:hypothetical protein
MRPLQLWLPFLGQSINSEEVGRDAQRAFQEWRGEPTVWLLPELEKPLRWVEHDTPQLAVPSEGFDRVDIVHVNKDGYVYAPTATERFVRRTVDGLLEAWLNVLKKGGPILVRAPNFVPLLAPHVTAEGVTFAPRTVDFAPGPFIPIVAVESRSKTVGMFWPPAGSPATVSPEAESLKRFPLERVEAAGVPEAVTSKGERAPWVFLQWPKPLRTLMPVLSSLDDMHSLALMMKFAQDRGGEPVELLTKAKSYAGRYLFDGHTTLEFSWFRPSFEQKGIRHIVLTAEDKGLTIPEALRKEPWDKGLLGQLLSRDDWTTVLSQLVPVRRVWGASGLLWALLLERLESGRGFVSCERCGRVISGKLGKRFCAASDDIVCFRARRTAERRVLRLRRKKA